MTDSSLTSPPAAAATPLLIPALAPLYDVLTPVADAAVRITTGLLLVPHGAQKLFGWFGGHGLEGTSQFFVTKLGLPGTLALVAGLIEFAGGLALAMGLLTRPVAALVAGLMAVAVFGVHWNIGFFWTAGGFEYPLLWGMVALSYAVRGGGRYALDRVLGREL